VQLLKKECLGNATTVDLEPSTIKACRTAYAAQCLIHKQLVLHAMGCPFMRTQAQATLAPIHRTWTDTSSTTLDSTNNSARTKMYTAVDCRAAKERNYAPGRKQNHTLMNAVQQAAALQQKSLFMACIDTLPLHARLRTPARLAGPTVLRCWLQSLTRRTTRCCVLPVLTTLGARWLLIHLLRSL
jgi:hypothetical protein